MISHDVCMYCGRAIGPPDTMYRWFGWSLLLMKKKYFSWRYIHMAHNTKGRVRKSNTPTKKQIVQQQQTKANTNGSILPVEFEHPEAREYTSTSSARKCQM